LICDIVIFMSMRLLRTGDAMNSHLQSFCLPFDEIDSTPVSVTDTLSTASDDAWIRSA